MRRRRWGYMALWLVVALVLAACAAPAAEQPQQSGTAGGETGGPETITIGTIYPRSGDMALLGEESWRGAELARLYRNKQGGINGKQIEFLNADAPNKDAARAEAERLINKEGIKVIFGTYSSSLSYNATDVANRYGASYFELGAISDPITDRGFPYVWRTCPPASAFGKVQVKMVVDLIAPALGKQPEEITVAFVHEDSLYGTTVTKFAKEAAVEAGLQIVAEQPYSAKTNDLSSVVLTLKDANPDVVIAVSYLTDAILLARQSKELGFKPKFFIGAGGGHSMLDFAEAVGDDVVGVLNVDFTQYAINRDWVPGMDEFIALYKETFNEPPRSGHSLANFMGALQAFEILEKAGSLDPEAIRAAALEMDVQEGTTPTGWGVKFDPNTGQNMRALPVGLMWVKEGDTYQQVTVYPKAAALREIIKGQ